MSFALHNKEAKLLPPDTFLRAGSAPDPIGSPDPLAGNGGGAPGKGEGKGKGKEVEGRKREGREGEWLSPRTKILATALQTTDRHVYTE